MSNIHRLQKPSGNKIHKHLHIHEHEHNCNRDHDHSHEDLYGESKEVPAVFSYTTSFELNKEVTADELQNSLVNWIESLRQWALQNKYFIGHIKIFVESTKEFNLWISTTGKGINVKTSEDNIDNNIKNININITAIIFGTDEKTLRSVTLESLNKNLLDHSKQY